MRNGRDLSTKLTRFISRETQTQTNRIIDERMEDKEAPFASGFFKADRIARELHHNKASFSLKNRFSLPVHFECFALMNAAQTNKHE